MDGEYVFQHSTSITVGNETIIPDIKDGYVLYKISKDYLAFYLHDPTCLTELTVSILSRLTGKVLLSNTFYMSISPMKSPCKDCDTIIDKCDICLLVAGINKQKLISTKNKSESNLVKKTKLSTGYVKIFNARYEIS
jgi:hypothetical protein